MSVFLCVSGCGCSASLHPDPHFTTDPHLTTHFTQAHTLLQTHTSLLNSPRPTLYYRPTIYYRPALYYYYEPCLHSTKAHIYLRQAQQKRPVLSIDELLAAGKQKGADAKV